MEKFNSASETPQLTPALIVFRLSTNAPQDQNFLQIT